jgi:nucleoside phosphorylase
LTFGARQRGAPVTFNVRGPGLCTPAFTCTSSVADRDSMRDLSTLAGAVKPRQRTDQYKILSALFCLGADTKPVTAREVKELLTLQFGTKIPSNIGTCLRRYVACVRVEKGPPLRWWLTPDGLSRLRELSGLALPTDSEDDFLNDVGIVCALDHPEFDAVMDAFGGSASWHAVGSAKFPHVYHACHLSTISGKALSIVGTTATSMGLTAASIVTTQLIMQFRPRIVVMVGIAAGTRDGNKQFGDILVADPSVDYNSGKVVRAGAIRDFLPDPYPIGLNPRLRSVLQRYRGDHTVLRDARNAWTGALPGSNNRLHLGPLGAADQVIDDATRVLEIQRNWRKLIGVEMETYGVYRACYEAPEPKPRFVSFKAVCDFAAEKTDSWQSFAAHMAAQFAMRFLKSEWESLWPTP